MRRKVYSSRPKWREDTIDHFFGRLRRRPPPPLLDLARFFSLPHKRKTDQIPIMDFFQNPKTSPPASCLSMSVLSVHKMINGRHLIVGASEPLFRGFERMGPGCPGHGVNSFVLIVLLLDLPSVRSRERTPVYIIVHCFSAPPWLV